MNQWQPLLSLEKELAETDKQLAAAPDNIDVRFKHAITLSELGRMEEAQNAYMELLTRKPTHFGALNNLGALLMSRKLATAALTAYREAVKHHPRNPKSHVNLADTLFKKGDMEEALGHFRIALQIDPDYKAAHQGMAHILTEMGDAQAARMHKLKGFDRNHTISIPYRGSGTPIVLVMLASSTGGMIPISQHLDDHIFHTTVVFVEFYDADRPLPPHQLVFNAIGDADLCKTDLEAAMTLLKSTQAPVVNPPQAVRLTGRMNNARRLADIPGVVAAKTVTFPREALAAEDAAIVLAAHGFAFPLLARSPGFHTGRNFMRVDSIDALKAELPNLPGAEMMVIEHLDAGGADGKIRKYRVMMIDGKLYPLHAAVSFDWKVHYFSADMANKPEHRAEDERFLTDMEKVLGSRAMKALATIRDTLNLDYAGIDFGLSADGKIILFEANATMTVNLPEPGQKWDYRRAPVQRIADAIRVMLTRKATTGTLPSPQKLLTTGGDRRIACDPVNGLNQYGCSAIPQPDVLSYSSSTASIISSEGFAAARQLRERLQQAMEHEPASAAYAREMTRIRETLIHLHGFSPASAPDILFAASGTDIHLLVSSLISYAQTEPLLAIIGEASETGSGVQAATGFRHFSDCTTFMPSVIKGAMLEGGPAIEVVTFASREADGMPRSAGLIDREVEVLAEKAIASGKRVLLTLIDVSKTGLIVPSLACALALRERFAEKIEILIDACQFRLASSTLHAYLEHGFPVAVTGSKFVTGPAFSGALLIPPSAANKLRVYTLPASLGAYSTRVDWPEGWAARDALPHGSNEGLLLRWEAALAELRAFHALPKTAIAPFLHAFANAARERMAGDPVFELLPVRELTRSPITAADSWDRIQTIFPFLLRRTGGDFLSSEETAQVYRRLRADRCHLGQPIPCGTRQGIPISSLRLCAGMRQIVDAVSPQGRGGQAVIAEMLSLLDKMAAFTAA